MSPDPDDFQVPDVIGEIVAYRAWRIVGPEQTPRLQSVTHQRGDDQIWPTHRWFPALCNGKTECRVGDKTIPGVGCSCGLYAARSMEHLLSMGYAGVSHGGSTVIGEVGFAGKVIRGTQGWRAERGRVLRLWVPIADYVQGELLGQAYRVPVEVASWENGRLKTLDDMVAEHETKEAS